MLRLTVALTLAALPALADPSYPEPQVMDCEWQASASAIVEPWAQNTRTFSDGKTRLAMLDTVEPAAGWAYLLILSPPYSELGDRQCKLIGTGGMGFSGMDFSGLQADYDPAQGLIFTLPVQFYQYGPEDLAWRTIRIVLNQATGQIDTWVLD